MSRAEDFAKKMMNQRSQNTVEKPVDDVAVDSGATSVLLNSMETDGTQDGEARLIPFSSIVVGKQHRTVFNEESIRELAEEIKQDGLLSPVLVRPLSDSRFELVLGERRYRAFQYLIDTYGDAWAHIRATVRALSDYEKSVIQLVENIQREDMQPIEEARALDSLKTEHKKNTDQDMTLAMLAERLGKSKSWISKRLALLDKPEDVQEALASGDITLDEAANKKTTSAKPSKREKPPAPPAARVNLEALEGSVRLLVKLAESLELNPIELPSKPARKDQIAAFELRAVEILDAAYRKING